MSLNKYQHLYTSPLEANVFLANLIAGQEQANLPLNTTIGNVTSAQIQNLRNLSSDVQAQLDLKDNKAYDINTVTENAKTFHIGDSSKIFLFTNTGTTNIYIPTHNSVPYLIGTYIDIVQWNTGQVVVNGIAGVNLVAPDNQFKTRTRYSSLSIIKVGLNDWFIAGDTTA
jgi:hypothetical protein